MYTLKQVIEIIDKSLKDYDLDYEPKNLYEPISYLLSIGGKRIRPAMTLLSCNLFSDSIDNAIFPALGIEIFHNFTLMHDDIMDNSPMRRNYPTVHTKWNTNTALLSGDLMCILSFQLITKTIPVILPQITDTFTKAAIDVCQGQQYDMEFEQRINVSEDEYIKMISLKTAALLAASFKIGAIVGRAALKDQENLYQVGKNIGIAFQLQDDLLDTFGNEAIFGKKIGNDIINNKKTYLLISALKDSNKNTKKELTQWLTKTEFDPEEKIKHIVSIYESLNIKTKTVTLINEYINKALSSLELVETDNNRKYEIYYFINQLKDRIK
jgi:geranylgeranyl diphosphate synthase type II